MATTLSNLTGNLAPDYNLGSTDLNNFYSRLQSGKLVLSSMPQQDELGNMSNVESIAGTDGYPIPNVNVTHPAPGVLQMYVYGGNNAGKNFVVAYDPKTLALQPVQNFDKQVGSYSMGGGGGGLFGGVVGDIVGAVSSIVKEMGPVGQLGLAAITGGLGSALATELGVSSAVGTALASTGIQVAQGVPIANALTSAATSYLGGSANSAVNQLVDEVGAAQTYGTDLGSQQTAMLAAQDAGMSTLGDIAGNTAGNVASSVVKSAITGTTPTINPISTLGSIASIGSGTSSDQLTTDNEGQPENIGLLDNQTTQTQAPDTQQVQDDVVVNANLPDNPTNASGQGNSMADILDNLGVDTTSDNIDIGGGFNPAGVDTGLDNFDLNAATSDLQDVYGGSSDTIGFGGGPEDTSTSGGGGGGGAGGTAAGGTTLASILKNVLPKTALGQAGLATGVGGVLQGLIAANAANKGAQIQADSAAASRAMYQKMFDTLNAQQAPYRGAGYGALNNIGQLGSGTYNIYDASGNVTGTGTGSGYLTKQFSPEDFAAGIDPGYAFRLQQGQMANQRAGNVSGGGLGGNVMRGLQDYTQGQASQEYNNAFNRFQTQRGNIYNTLAGIAGIGQTGQSQTNQLGTNLANANANLNIGQAGAQAAGQIGQANAYSGALNSINQAVLLSQLPDIASAMKG